MPAQPIPEGHNTVIPHLTVSDGKKAIEFYVNAFGAEKIDVSIMPDGNVIHADIKIGDSHIFLNDQFGPPGPPPSGVTINLWVTNADEAWERAVKAGATVQMPLQNQFWGDKYGKLTDPFGHSWAIAQHVEDLSKEEIAQRADAWFKQMAGGG